MRRFERLSTHHELHELETGGTESGGDLVLGGGDRLTTSLSQAMDIFTGTMGVRAEPHTFSRVVDTADNVTALVDNDGMVLKASGHKGMASAPPREESVRGASVCAQVENTALSAWSSYSTP